MQKTAVSIYLSSLIAIPALAQAQVPNTVNLSGYLDLGVWRDFGTTGAQVSTIQRSSVVFSGTEDLGNGHQAVFRLESRFDMNTGALEGPGKPFWHGEATVGMRGNWGTLRMGRGLTALWSQDWKFDAWYNFNRIASPAWQFWHSQIPTDRISNSGNREYGRLNNGVFYDSPNFGGFNVYLSASPQRTDGAGRGRARAASVVYDQNGWGAMAAYDRNGSSDRGHFLAGKVPLGKTVSLMLAHDVSQSREGIKAKSHTVSGTWTLGAAALKLGYGHLDLDGASLNFYGAGAEYNLSKRTMAYLSAGHLRPGGAASSKAYGLGLAHSF